MLKDGPTPASLFVYFRLFAQKILAAGWIRTRIIRVEGEDTDHKTTTIDRMGTNFSNVERLLGQERKS